MIWDVLGNYIVPGCLSIGAIGAMGLFSLVVFNGVVHIVGNAKDRWVISK